MSNRKADEAGKPTGSANAGAVIGRMKDALGVRTDAELAALVGVSQSAPANWRKDGVPPKHLLKVHQRTGVPVEFLRTGLMSGTIAAELLGSDTILRALQDALGEHGAVAEAVLALVLLPGEPQRASTHMLALALVEAEQSYRAERPGEEFRASQLAEQVIRILQRNRHLHDAARRRGASAEYVLEGLRTSLGLPKNWKPSDPW